jgi:hypothetical protein
MLHCARRLRFDAKQGGYCVTLAMTALSGTSQFHILASLRLISINTSKIGNAWRDLKSAPNWRSTPERLTPSPRC